MVALGNIVTTGLWPALYLLLVAIAPLLIFAALVHLLEKLIQRRLVSRFGWNSVLWTGWLGTPIHELSHALFCILFRHRIEEIALFSPDLESGRLGYVRHSYRSGNLYEEIGNVFIGIAPLVGGTFSLTVLLMLFYPDVGREALLIQADTDSSFWTLVATSIQSIITGILNWQNVATLRFWLFLYLVLCVGSHMAPSPSDYRGALKGSLFLFLLLLVASLAVSVVATTATTIKWWLAPVLVPTTTVLILALILCSLAAVMVFLLTEISDRLFGRR